MEGMKKFLLSFRYARQGLSIAWREEKSFRIEIAIATLAICASVLLGLSRSEFSFILLLIFFVLTVEALNTALEELCDKFTQEHDPHIAKIKDLAAAAVLLASIGAGLIGILIFLPRILLFF